MVTITTWPLGCHSRQFGSFRATHADNPDFILDSVGGRAAAITPEMLAAMKQKLAARGLRSNVASLPTAARGVTVANARANREFLEKIFASL